MMPTRILPLSPERILKRGACCLGVLIISLVGFGHVAHAKEKWLPIKDADLQIKPGNVLDFSALVDHAPAGKHGRVIITRDGHLGFAEQDDKNQRFLCGTLQLANGFPDHKEADLYARQLRMHGYNLARFHFVDAVLMDRKDKDFDFDPELLDRFYYLMAALKREGIYWMVDGVTSWNGAYGGVYPTRFAKRYNVKLGLYYNEDDQEHWKKLIKRLFGKVNPYTKIRPLDDPALAAIILVNEGGLNFQNGKEFSEQLKPLYITWLKQRYKTVDDLKKAWGNNASDSSINSFDDIEFPKKRWGRSTAMADLQRFFTEQETAATEWMTRYLRDQGYEGVVSNFNNTDLLQAHASRAPLDVVIRNSYFASPQNFVKPGATIKQNSSLEEGALYVQRLATTKYLDRPFIVSETGQPFWNSWRREYGVVAPSYASLQQWDVLCAHAFDPIVLSYEKKGTNKRRQAIYPFGLGMDPIARTGETLAALLFLRGDVAPAHHRTAIKLSSRYVYDQNTGLGHLPEDVTATSLVTGTGLYWAEDNTSSETLKSIADMTLNPGPSLGKSDVVIDEVSSKLGMGTRAKWAQRVKELRKAAILSEDNITQASEGIYQSDTGELILERDKKRMRVVTPYTEAVAFSEDSPVKLSQLMLESADGPAMVAASSVDGAPLSSSKRILIILATDALNSDMEFADSNRHELLKLGNLPILMRPARVELTLHHQQPDTLRLYSASLNGERKNYIPVKLVPGGLRFTLDTYNLTHGPTTYFELVNEE